MEKNQIPSPAVLVDLDIAEKNLARVIQKARQANIQVRPHMKVHKSVYFAKKQIAAGACGLTAAKLAEAEVMAANGIDNILIAYQLVGQEKWDRFGVLNRKVNVLTTVDSLEVAKGLKAVASPEHPVHVLIEVDSGTHRCGVQPGEEFTAFATMLGTMEGLKIEGVFTYNGLIYGSASQAEILKSAAAERKILIECEQRLRSLGINCRILSGGNTPDTLALDQMRGVTEVRPGNFLYNDVSGLDLGTATEADCALRIFATIVSVPQAGRATIDAGSKSLTTDRAAKSPGYGKIIGMPDVNIVKLNEEHGFIEYDLGQRNLRVGDRLEIIPNHACVISNLCDFVYGIRAGRVEETIKIDARGGNY